MDKTTIEKTRAEFLKAIPDFKNFEHPPTILAEQELDYKIEAAKRIRSILGDYVDNTREFTTDDEAQQVLSDVLDLTNFLSWRDKAYLAEQLFIEEGDWLKFGRMMVRCLQQADSGDWQQPLLEILDWLQAKECKASITKILPTYFLFLWRPSEHFCVKARFTDKFLQLLGEAPLGQGKPLTVDGYQRVVKAFKDFREAISDWQPKNNIDIHSLAWVVTSDGWKEMPAPSDSPQTIKSRDEPTLNRPTIPLNLILAGPPGTGKTYRLLNKYLPMFEEPVAEQSLEDFVYEQCGSLHWHEACVVGLRLLGRAATVKELVTTEPVKARMKSRANKKYVTNTLWVQMSNHTPEDCQNVSVPRHVEPALFWKNNDPTWQLVDGIEQVAPDLIALADEIQHYQPTGTVVRRHELVTFHQSYSYEDFVEGIKPEMGGADEDGEAGQVTYTISPGIFRRIVQRAKEDPTHSYALFIDEINRANISNVFGELITLLEPDKRTTYDSAAEAWTGGVSAKLPYTHSARPQEPPFSVPDNLYVIGTMNTADRSIALLDLALRRRFTFDEVMPDPEVLARHAGPVVTDDGREIQLDRLLDAINQRIEYLYDRDHTIGHSYLINVKTLDDLERAFRQKLLPLLQEYFYGDWYKIQLVLGDLTREEDTDHRPKAHPDAIVSHVVQRPRRLFGVEDEAYQDRRSYIVSEEMSAESFLKIYQSSSRG